MPVAGVEAERNCPALRKSLVVADLLSGGAGVAPVLRGKGGGVSDWNRGGGLKRNARDGEAVAARGGGAVASGAEVSFEPPWGGGGKQSASGMKHTHGKTSCNSP